MGEEREKAGKESIEELENAIMRNFRIPFRITREAFTGKKEDRAGVERLKPQDEMCANIKMYS